MVVGLTAVSSLGLVWGQTNNSLWRRMARRPLGEDRLCWSWRRGVYIYARQVRVSFSVALMSKDPGESSVKCVGRAANLKSEKVWGAEV